MMHSGNTQIDFSLLTKQHKSQVELRINKYAQKLEIPRLHWGFLCILAILLSMNMQEPQVTKLDFSYTKENGKVWVINKQDIPIDVDRIQDEQIVYFSPGSVGGNHAHPRTEWFIGIGELVLYWQDESGKRYEQFMKSEGKVLLIKIPPYLPHAVKNISDFKFGVLFEYADAKQHSVEQVQLV